MSVRNITKAYRLASDAEVLNGLTRYNRARALATELDPNNIERAAGIIAVLSPMTSWPQNVRLARGVYGGIVPKCLPRNSAKAMALYNGANPKDVVSGPKVTSFFTNILGGDDAIVTIDRHAIDIAAGRVQSNDVRSSQVGGKARYDALVKEFIQAARIISKETGAVLTGSQMQAITWVYWRNNKASNNHGDA